VKTSDPVAGKTLPTLHHHPEMAQAMEKRD
jgi:hypothetical protein